MQDSHHSRWTVLCLLTAGFLLCYTPPASADAILFVDDDAPPAGDGLSWDSAYRFPQDALAHAAETPGEAYLIRIAQGTYFADRDETHPDGTQSPQMTFTLLNDVELIGGYAGLGAADPDAHDIGLYETILSGDIDGNDLPNFINYDHNSLHVVTASDTQPTAVIDGITITAGNCTDDYYDNNRGSGLYAEAGSPMIIDCTFIRNLSDTHGAGMAGDYDADPTFVGCSFIDNLGGGIDLYFADSTLTDCYFEENRSVLAGGAMNNYAADVAIVDCVFIANASLDDGSGGSFYNGSGGAIRNNQCSSTITGCVFNENSAAFQGGAIDNVIADLIDITDCTFADNEAGQKGGAMRNSGGYSGCVLADSALSGNSAAYSGGAVYNTGYAHVFTNCAFVANTTFGDGGAICNSPGADPMISDCLFTANTAAGGGGAVASDMDSMSEIFNCEFIDNAATFGAAVWNDGNSDPVITACYFSGNSAEFGGAICNGSLSSPLLTDCMFSGNFASFDGGAVFGDWYCSFTAVNCLFIHNFATNGGAAFNSDSSPTFINCTIAENTASVSGGGIYNTGNSNPTLANTIAWDNVGYSGSIEDAQISGGNPDVNYSCIQGWTGNLGGTGNIGDDPAFVQPDADDYRLSFDSPCIDAADNTAVPTEITTDLAGEARFVDDPDTDDTGVGDPPIVDMGAYEYQADQCPADVTGDETVDVLDLLAILNAWGQSQVPEDINGDGVVDVLDLLEVLNAWGPCS